jgi:hypothetical protein
MFRVCGVLRAMFRVVSIRLRTFALFGEGIVGILGVRISTAE